MLPKKYHAIAFLSILVMLLLLGLHLLGFGFLGGSGGQAARSTTAAALARNSTSGSSSSLLSPTGASSTLNPNAVYRHPIVYDKLTGATNNEINDVLGGLANKQDQYPLDHYQQQSQQVRSQNPFDSQFNPAPHDPFANHLARQFGGPHPHPPGHHHGMGRPPSLGPPPSMGMGPPHTHQLPLPLPPPPPPPISHQQHMMTTQPPHNSPQASSAAPSSAAEQRHSQQDSLPSASSVNNNGATRPLNSTAAQQPQYYHQQSQPQQPVYYTPPIFTYSNNNFDPSQQQQQQQQSPYQPQVPPLGVPEVPLSVDEYNARQNRLRQLQQSGNQQLPTSDDATPKQQVNLLADPQAQQRHKQQMLDRQLLFGPPSPSSSGHFNHQNLGLNPNQLSYMQPPPPPPPVDNYTSAAYYPDPALYAARLQQQPLNNIRPPYAHQMPPQQNGYQPPPPTQLEAPTQLAHSSQQLKQLAPQNRVMNNQRPPERIISAPLPAPQQQSRQQPLVASSVVRSGQQAPSGANTVAASTRLALHEQPAPVCVRQQQQQQQVPFTSSSLELANSTSQMPVLFCNEDSEYPTTEIMRALEQYAADKSIELILPQQLVQMLTSSGRADNNPKLADLQRQLSLDSLQANINAQQVSSGNSHLQKTSTEADDTQQQPGIFPTSNYDSLCRSVTWMAQPRRAKNLSGQWKVVVNLPGHKFRGIAISQMVRVDECSRPNSECSSAGYAIASPTSGQLISAAASVATKQTSMPARSRCLQHYDNQRLLAWSNQQGLHFDIFRVPIACSCHIRRF